MLSGVCSFCWWLIVPFFLLFVTQRASPFLIIERQHSRYSSRLLVSSDKFWVSNSDCWRPDENDVERISFGKPAKKKGTGSRGIPHRLNEDERFLFDLARRKGFLEVMGSGWRSQRRDAPLLNTYRSLCDARGQVCICVHKGSTGMDDEVVVDLSPLRHPKSFEEVASICIERVSMSGASVSSLISNHCDSGGIHDSCDSSPKDGDLSAWNTRPIYQLLPFYISWTMTRQEAKETAKTLALLFQTAEKKTRTKKPVGVKPGKGRRHGGYGIG